MKKRRNEEIRRAVRKAYGEIARGDSTGCGCVPSSCCGSGDDYKPEDITVGLGYSIDDLSKVPESANMGLGCGNPRAIASLQPGETVLDLGSGGGLDCLLAARAVGKGGYVIGVDMTPEMVDRSRKNAEKAGLHNVEFRLGEIENLPVADHSVDVIISNCVVNLSPEKAKVFREAYRVLKRGGRLQIADVVSAAPLPDELKKDVALHTGCVSGAAQIDELKSMLEETGFTDVRITPLDKSRRLIREWLPGRNMEDYIVSASIEAVKPLKD